MPHTTAEKAWLPCVPNCYVAWGTLSERLASRECYGNVNLANYATHVNTLDRNAFIASSYLVEDRWARFLCAASLMWQQDAREDGCLRAPGLRDITPRYAQF